MSFWTKIIDGIKGNEDFSEIKSSTFRDFINGSILNKKFIRKQYKLLVLIAVLAVFYIDNRYTCEKQIAEVGRLKKELEDVKFESLTIAAELTKNSRKSHILNTIASKGFELTESLSPPVLVEEPRKENAESKKMAKAKEEHKRATELIKKDTTDNEEYIKQ